MDNLLEILATPKQVGLLIGAGVSKACGLPNVEDLTKEVRKVLTNENFIKLIDDTDNVETILNKTQQLRSLVTNGNEINGLKLSDINDIEEIIKKTIYEKLSPIVDYENLCKLVIWLNFINQEHEKEIFSLNYDLLLEMALEKNDLPYFSGFIGSVKPFFVPDSVDDFNGIYVKRSWTKLWKLHGSLNFKKSKESRIFIENGAHGKYEDLLIYPSMDKYLSSRKAPFISYLDRLRKYLLINEKVIFILGYSFSDDHINDLIINGLNNNSRLSIFAFTFDDITYKKGIDLLGLYPNVSIYTDKKKYINRTESEFEYNKNIGDFNCFVEVLNTLIKPNEINITKEA